MKKHRKTIQYIVLAFVLLIGGYAVGNSLFASSPVLKAGDKPPAFKLADTAGNVHDSSEYRGKPVIINFWGTFCPPCRDEMPALQNVYDKWKDKGVQLIGINLSEDKLTAESFARQVGAEFPILLDRNRQTEKKFGLKQYPTTFFVRADGTIEEILIGGPLTEEQIEGHIEKIMNAK
ncbi:redoxin domain-containing protein [Cohnella sp. CFH 77786]|uniref:redoxin domain-containing protein n=1 Tax=Cohnella sp. CFH 77786 TaxID=2662265 RepID=UPI001C609DC3|nr:redoxin domain-containing protein [Cohnella sp. CFH 77786]MBW5446683.1 redoxin domain-containing protein [Cohnella sp. CFH 77786]